MASAWSGVTPAPAYCFSLSKLRTGFLGPVLAMSVRRLIQPSTKLADGGLDESSQPFRVGALRQGSRQRSIGRRGDKHLGCLGHAAVVKRPAGCEVFLLHQLQFEPLDLLQARLWPVWVAVLQPRDGLLRHVEGRTVGRRHV